MHRITRSNLYLLPFLIFFSFVYFGCPKGKPPAVAPPEPTTCEYPAGNRNFAWRLDTVAWYPSEVGGVWAFSDSDAWVMGNMQGLNVNGQTDSYVGFHWNGNSWNEKVDFLDILMKADDVIGDNHIMVAVGYRLYGDTMGGAVSKPAIAEFDNNTKKWNRSEYDLIGELRSVWTDGNGYFIAVGDNGMVYAKDGYDAEWVYSKLPSDFNFLKISGVSKKEIYIVGYNNLVTGESYDQVWKYDGELWRKLFDTQDSTQQVLPITNEEYVGDVFPLRCNITDSLTLYVIGQDSYRLQAKGQLLEFSKIDLATLGLPLKQNGRTGVDINAYSPNDVWIFGTRYNFYQWNGTDFQKIVIPGLPNDDMHFGIQQKMIKTSSGKLFLPTEVSPQVYVVVQGTP